MLYSRQEFNKRLIAISNTNIDVRVVGHLMNTLQPNATSSWQQGMIAKLINMFTNAANLIEKFKDNPDALLRSSGLQEWQGSDPMSFSLEVLFHREQNVGNIAYRGENLNQNVNELMKLVLPSGFGAGGTALRAPAGFAITRVKDGDFSFVTQLDEIINGNGSYVRGASSITISQNGKLLTRIPNFLIVKSVTPQYGGQLDGRGGYRWIKCTVEMETLFAPTADKFAEWFANGIDDINPSALGAL